MAFCHVRWKSEVIGKAVGLNALLPDCGNGPFPVYYLLHGLSDDDSVWLRRTRIEWYVRDLPLIVIMPDGFRGFYTNHEEGPQYATYMAEELPEQVERWFPARVTGKARCVGGLSMGGYGALRLALGYPGRYVSANSHSGALLFGHNPVDTSDPRAAEFRRITGPLPAGGPHDLLALAQSCVNQGGVPGLKIDCGTEDFLLDDNRTFVKRLTSSGIECEYNEYPGAHTWDYWDIRVQEALAFHAGHLDIAENHA